MSIISNFKDKKILVIGDLIVDRYITGKAYKISQEAPVPVLRFEQEEWRLGGAANVAANLFGLGARPYLLGVIGSDHEGRKLTEMINSLTLSTAGLVVDNMRKTSIKTRICSGNQQIVRVDKEDTNFINQGFEKALLAHLTDIKPDAIIIEDYAKGVITHNVVNGVMAFAKEHDIRVMLDPNPKGVAVKGAYLMTPNLKEALSITNLPKSTDIEEVASTIMTKYDCKHVAITLGDEGIYMHNSYTSKLYETIPREVYDPSGAGDTVIAVMTLGIVCGLTIDQTVRLANIAAGIVVTQPGTTPITIGLLTEDL